MKLFNLLKTFQKDEDGAVTVDWVVLTAAIVGLGIIVMNVIEPKLYSAASSIGSGISNAGTQASQTLTYSGSTAGGS